MATPYTRVNILELKWGSSQAHREVARQAGMNALDVEYVAEICLDRHLLVIMRAPKVASRQFDGGLLPAKPASIKGKADPRTGTITADGVTYISDYDLMSVWKGPGQPYRKVFFSENAHGVLGTEAQALMSELNRGLIRKLQHGANDDWRKNGKVRNRAIEQDSFVVWHDNGSVEYRPTMPLLHEFYLANNLSWPY